MPAYSPIPMAVAFAASQSEMMALKWQRGEIVADFSIPNDLSHVLRVRFDNVDIARILDEMALSTEADPTRNVGIVADHFAYSVEDSNFWRSQSEALLLQFKAARHYRFFTGGTCLDVIARMAPSSAVVPT